MRWPNPVTATIPGAGTGTGHLFFFPRGSAVAASATAERARDATLGYATRAPIKARFNEAAPAADAGLASR